MNQEDTYVKVEVDGDSAEQGNYDNVEYILYVKEEDNEDTTKMEEYEDTAKIYEYENVEDENTAKMEDYEDTAKIEVYESVGDSRVIVKIEDYENEEDSRDIVKMEDYENAEDIADTAEMEEYENVEYLEDEDECKPEDSQGMKLNTDVPSAATPKPCKRKYPPKLPKHMRNKTYMQYTVAELRKAVQGVMRGELRFVDACKMYGIPKCTLRSKVNGAIAGHKQDEAKDASDEKHYKLIEELRTILIYTNATPFRTKSNRYYCFYCDTDKPFFEEPEDLRKHTIEAHTSIKNMERYLKPQWKNEIVKLDIENLHCHLCDILLFDWNKMFAHFAEEHDIGFDVAYTKIIPYALSFNLYCVLCHEKFHNYGHLDAHMNQHYCNYICYECGDTYLAASRLDKHLKVHKVGTFACEFCDKVFTLERYRAKHCALVHLQEKKLKCLYCAEKFVDPLQRHKHVEKEHKEKVKTMTCEVCGKLFTCKAYFLQHMRKRHNGVKKHKCPHCPKAFVMQYELKVHMVKHMKEKNIVCLCGESFKSTAGLKRHVKLTHDDKPIFEFMKIDESRRDC